MKMVVSLGIALVSGLALPAGAQDASFGCKVLMCAVASNPSWSGIPYCVPVMQDLFTSLKKGGSWPTCAEGNASPVGMRPYNECPIERTAVSVSAGNIQADPNGTSCARDVPVTAPDRAALQCPQDGPCFDPASVTGRPLNPKPYYVDIGVSGQTQRFWFNLNGTD